MNKMRDFSGTGIDRVDRHGRTTRWVSTGELGAARRGWIASAVISMGLALPAAAQTTLTTRLSVGPGGVQSNNTSFNPRITDDGRYVVFSSYASNLVPVDTNFKSDIFVRDNQLGTNTLVSVDSNGVQANGDCYFPAISNDGRYVVFESIASNLVPGDTNNVLDIFVRDMLNGTTVRVSVDSNGNQSDAHSYTAVISGDGRYVAFASDATNLVPGDTNGKLDVFVHDMVTGTTTRASVDSSGAQCSGASQSPSISGNGRFVAFQSLAPDLVAGDTNGVNDVFVHDNVTGTTTRVSVDSNGAQGNGESVYPWISESGHLVSFASAASNLVPNDLNGAYDIFLHDMQSGQIRLISITKPGVQGNADSYYSAISADERWVTFDSLATNLTPTDSNPLYADIFLRDMTTGEITLQSVSSSGFQSNYTSTNPTISGDGRFITFESGAWDLVPFDTNLMFDIFMRDLNATGSTSLCDPGVAGVMACPCSNPPAAPGRGCDNSSATGGALVVGSGLAYLSMDSLVFTTSGEKPTATSIVLQGNALNASGAVFGQGVRCATGVLKRLYTKTASAGSITAPNFGAGDPTVSTRSSALGDTIAAGQSRWYLVYYRDPVVLGGCPSASTFNATQTMQIAWSL
jgi:hypothetical protein